MAAHLNERPGQTLRYRFTDSFSADVCQQFVVAIGGVTIRRQRRRQLPKALPHK